MEKFINCNVFATLMADSTPRLQIRDLSDHLGEEVVVSAVRWGEPIERTGVLTSARFTGRESPVESLSYGRYSSGFITYGFAVRRISSGGEVLFDNPAIPDDYNLRSADEILALRRQCFGPLEPK